MMLIDDTFKALHNYENKLLRTPIVNFYGVEGIRKTGYPSSPNSSRHRRRKLSAAKPETKQQGIILRDSGNTEPRSSSSRRWNDPGTVLFLLVALTYLIMSVLDFLKTGSPVMLTIVLFYAGAYLQLNLLPILPVMKEIIREWVSHK